MKKAKGKRGKGAKAEKQSKSRGGKSEEAQPEEAAVVTKPVKPQVPDEEIMVRHICPDTDISG